MNYPNVRMRRLRSTPALRRLRQETQLSPDELMYPIFVTHGHDVQDPIGSMPGQFRWSVDRLPDLARTLTDRGVRSVMVFGLPATKDDVGSQAWADDGIVQTAARTLKGGGTELLVVADTCLDEYTSHGHCGVLRNGEVDNDATLDVLGQVAVSQARAGVDMVAPSDMMDGRVGVIRAALDAHGFERVPIISYAVKYASAFYGPFRDAADCAPQFGDRSAYQMDPANRREAILEARLDVDEGADIIMVKPALPYLDIIRDVRNEFDVPVAAYHVSGEYAMIRAAAQRGWIDERAVVLESLIAIKRAGAGIILTYFACEAAEWLQT